MGVVTIWSFLIRYHCHYGSILILMIIDQIRWKIKCVVIHAQSVCPHHLLSGLNSGPGASHLISVTAADC